MDILKFNSLLPKIDFEKVVEKFKDNKEAVAGLGIMAVVYIFKSYLDSTNNNPT